MIFEEIALNIKRAENGIYYLKSDSSISYPEEGNVHCLQIEYNSIYNYNKDDGYIFITVPDFNFQWSYEDDDAGHHKRCSKTKLNDLLLK